ncbi:MAG TPA: hypothetical protein EYO33_25425 [Phycisphaerales bacterium]|nr:hypothetical protein [Phycisphaerales bacterium]
MIAIIFALLLLPILFAPLETAQWASTRPLRPEPEKRKEFGPAPPLQLVYFTGVAGYSGDFLARREKALLDQIQELCPGITVHHDVFPYSVSNLPLNGERVFRTLWMWLHKWRLKIPNNVFDVLIVIRNIGQLLVSADPRYGPSYNSGLAEVMEERLHPDAPTVFLAYSGGAQMAVGAARKLEGFLTHKPHLVALGGVFTDDPGIAAFETVVQLRGKRDYWVPELGRLIYPGLWRWQFWSTWNRYRRSGKFRKVTSGLHCHVGKSDYFGFDKLPGNTEKSYGEQSAESVAKMVRKWSNPICRPEVRAE